MIDIACIWDFLSSNQDHIWYFFSGVGAVGTLFIASKALNTWHKEKRYDLTIENLAICNLAVQYIAALRYPASSTSEIKKEYQEKLNKETIDAKQKSASEALYIYQSRRDRHQDLFENILKLREKNWAVYGEEHEFYLFFNRVVEIDKQVMMANIRHFHAIRDREEYGDETFREIMKETDPVIYSGLNNKDEIERELTDWIEKLKKYRKKQ